MPVRADEFELILKMGQDKVKYEDECKNDAENKAN